MQYITEFRLTIPFICNDECVELISYRLKSDGTPDKRCKPYHIFFTVDATMKDNALQLFTESVDWYNNLHASLVASIVETFKIARDYVLEHR